MFSFPELVFVVMGVLVLMGGYTGYRLAELVRFRMLTSAPAVAAPLPAADPVATRRDEPRRTEVGT
jgi:hypothetical protein